MGQFFRRLRYLLQRRRFDRELANDMEFHREMAAMAGRSNFGNTLHLREESRDAWGWTWIERLAQDVRFAARLLRKSPGFTLAAVLMLAIGIGMNVAVFGFFDLMFLRPLDVRDPASLLRFHRRAEPQYAFALPYPEMAFFRDHTRTLSAVLAVNLTRLAIEGEGAQAFVNFVSANLFHDLGPTPVLGRFLEPARDEAPGAAPVVVLSYGFWQRHFGGDPSVVGRTIRMNGKPAEIIGVAPQHFSGLSLNQPPLWAPVGQQPYYVSGSRLLTDYSVESPGVQMWGRLMPGLTPAAAEQELASLAAELHKRQPLHIWEKEHLPSEPGGYTPSLIIGNRRGTGSEGRDDLYPVFALAATMVLLIFAVACGNLGSLLLARGVAREREIAIRISVGAGSGRLIRQLITESILMGLAGAAAGLAVGYEVLRGMLAATGSPAWLDPTPDWRVTAFSAGIGLLASMLFGLTPALQLARQRQRATAFRQFLVCAQVAASCVLLIVAGLLARALSHATSTDPGFEYQHVISIEPGLARNGYSTEKARAYLDALEARLRGLPGVESVSLALSPPLGNSTSTAGVDINGRPFSMVLNHVDARFFQTMRIPLLRGRNLSSGDTHVTVIGESLARAAWPGQDPLGKTLTIGADYMVVGIVGAARTIKPQDSDSREVYFPIESADLPSVSIMARSVGAPEELAKSAALAAHAIDASSFAEVHVLKNQYRQKLRSAESGALAVSVLGLVAHLLACLGILGVVAYGVSQRTREIGIRLALGARPAEVLTVVLRQFSAPVLAGLAIGVCGAAALSKFLRGMLYGISHLDPVTYVGVIVLFLVTVALAALLPASRALRIDPVTSLRHE